MKPLLARLPLRKSIGICIGDAEVAASLTVAAPWGPIEVERVRVGVVAGQLESALSKLFALPSWAKCPVAVALPERSTFFSTRPVHGAALDLQPHAVLREALQSPGVHVHEMLVDLLEARPDKRTVASIVACNKKYFDGVLAGLKKVGVCPEFVEAAPHALLRAATRTHRPPMRSKTVLRVLLGETQGLAILVCGKTPLIWRSFTLPAGDEAGAVLSVARSLDTAAKYCGVDTACDTVMIHGRGDLRDLLGFEWLQDQLGTVTQWHDGPSLDEGEAAHGVALRTLIPEDYAFDLFRTQKPTRSLAQIIPWKQLVLQCGILLCIALLLADRLSAVQRVRHLAEQDNAQEKELASLSADQLLKEKNQLEARLQSIRRYLDTRIVWTSYLRDISGRLPESVALTSLHGEWELEASGKAVAKPKKSFVLRATAPLRDDGAMSRDIDNLLDALREYPRLLRDFPNVELTGLQQVAPTAAAPAMVQFNVVCLPKNNKTPGNAAATEP